MDTSIWGSKFWFLLHIILIHTKSDVPQSVYKTFFINLQYLLPCGKCRRHYRNHLRYLPFPDKKKDNNTWLIKIHNRVNRSLKQPEIDVGVATMYWENQYKFYTTNFNLTNKNKQINLKKIAEFLLDAYNCNPIKEPHLFFWKNINRLLPFELPVPNITLREFEHYEKWISLLKLTCII